MTLAKAKKITQLDISIFKNGNYAIATGIDGSTSRTFWKASGGWTPMGFRLTRREVTNE